MPWVTHFHMVLPIFKELKNIVKLFAIDCKYRIEKETGIVEDSFQTESISDIEGHILGFKVTIMKFLKIFPPKIDVEINEIRSSLLAVDESEVSDLNEYIIMIKSNINDIDKITEIKNNYFDIRLIFSGDSILLVKAEEIESSLEDFGKTWETNYKPKHKI